MQDYRIRKIQKGYIIERVIVTILWWSFFKKQGFASIERSKNKDRYKEVVMKYPIFQRWDDAFETAEFNLKHTKRKYGGFKLIPIYAFQDDPLTGPFPFLDSLLYCINDDRMMRIGRPPIHHGHFLKLTAIIDDYHTRTTKNPSQKALPD